MPGTTSPRNYPYPVGTDPINVASDIKKLAEAIDNDVAAIDSAYKAADNTLTGKHNTQNDQIGTLQSQAIWLQQQIDSMNTRKPLMYYATNDYGIPLAAAPGWTNYGCGQLVLPGGFYWDTQIVGTISIGNGGGWHKMCLALNGVQRPSGMAGSQLPINEAVTLTHTMQEILAPATYDLSFTCQSNIAGNTVGSATISVIALPRW